MAYLKFKIPKLIHSKSNISFLNSLPNNKILYLSKLKAFADDKTNVIENLKSGFERVENIVGKAENAGYHLFPQCFQRQFSKAVLER